MSDPHEFSDATTLRENILADVNNFIDEYQGGDISDKIFARNQLVNEIMKTTNERLYKKFFGKV